jgi:hypothetical protein
MVRESPPRLLSQGIARKSFLIFDREAAANYSMQI